MERRVTPAGARSKQSRSSAQPDSESKPPGRTHLVPGCRPVRVDGARGGRGGLHQPGVYSDPFNGKRNAIPLADHRGGLVGHDHPRQRDADGLQPHLCKECGHGACAATRRWTQHPPYGRGGGRQRRLRRQRHAQRRQPTAPEHRRVHERLLQADRVRHRLVSPTRSR